MKLILPPSVVRVVGADYFKSHNVIDLTGHAGQDDSVECGGGNGQVSTSDVQTVQEGAGAECETVETPQSPLPQNQLMDKKAREIFDGIWLSNKYMHFLTVQSFHIMLYISNSKAAQRYFV